MTFPTGWDGPKYFAAQLAPESVRTDWSPPIGEPGIVQPRPLSFGDVLGGVFRAVRYAPGTMFGLTLILTLAAQLLGMGLGYLLGKEFGMNLLASDEADGGELAIFSWTGVAGLAATALAQLVIGAGLSWATFEAVRARKTSPLEAARRIADRFWPMLGVYALPALACGALFAVAALLLPPLFEGDRVWVGVAVVVLGGLTVTVFAIWLGGRLLLSPCLVAIENLGPIAAIRRSWTLSRGQFWRITSTYLAVAILISMATSVLSTVFSLAVTLVSASNTEWGTTISTSASSLTSAVFSLPLTTALATLLYVDARIRNEAFDLELSEDLFG